MFYTYIHKTADEGRTFYVGKGKGKRATWPHTRGAHWNSVVKKHGGFVAEIVGKFDTEQEAFDYERFLIASFRALGVGLVNKTNGGDGVAGHKHSEETRRRLSEMHKGKTISDETRRRMSASRMGKPVPALRVARGPYSEERRAKLRKPKSEQAKANMKAARANQCKPIACIETGLVFSSMAHAEQWLRDAGHSKARKSALCGCCSGKIKSAYGFTWKYATQKGSIA